jgi:hypothetical protein
MIMNKEEIIEKVRKLLRLSESPNEHEALLAATKAREFLSTYNLSLADLSEEDLLKHLGVIEVSTSSNIKLEEWIQVLASHIARIFDCYVLGQRLEKAPITFVGMSSDAEVAAYTFEFLQRKVDEMATGVVRTKREEQKGIDEESYRQTYLIGAVQRIREELVRRSLVFKKQEKELCTSLVLYKKKNLDSYLKEKFPGLESEELFLVDLDRESFYRGYNQAKRIQVNPAVGEGV